MDMTPMTFLDDCAHAIAAEAHFLRGDALDDWHDHLEAAQPQPERDTDRQAPAEA